MTIKWLLAMVFLAGFHLPTKAEEPLTYARAVEVLQQQVQRSGEENGPIFPSPR